MIRGVVFDLGETLIHFEGDWEEISERSRRDLISYLRREGVDLPERKFSEALRRHIEAAQDVREEDYVERPARAIIEDTLREFSVRSISAHRLEEAVARMFAASEDHWLPVPALRATLEQVAELGVRMGLISNASDVENVQRLVDKAGMRSYFDPILVSAGVGVRKPAKAIFERLLSAWRLPPGETVMVGDTLRADILGAQRAGMQQIWVRTAEHRADNQALLGEVQPQRTVETLAEVPVALRTMAQARESADG